MRHIIVNYKREIYAGFVCISINVGYCIAGAPLIIKSPAHVQFCDRRVSGSAVAFTF